MYDAMHVLVQALTMLDRSTRLRLVNLTCDGDQAWAFGSSLYNYLNLVGIQLASDQLANLSIAFC